MNNIQKNFKGKAKRGLCMATGGILDQAERDQLRFDQAQSMKQDALTAGNAQIGEIAGARGLSNRQRSRSIGDVRGVMSSFGAVGDQPSIRGLSARQQNSAGIADFTSGLRAQSANNTLAAADPALTAAAPTSAPTVQPDDRGWKRVDIANGGMFMADGGIVGSDGLTDAQRAKLSGARTNLGVSNAAPAPAPAAPTPAPAAPAPAQQAPSIGGAVNSIRERQRMLNNLAAGGVIGNAAEYWANDNAEFEKTNPNFGRRVLRSVNPLTGFGSAMGAMHTAAGNGDIPGMAMAGISAIPAFGVLRAVPATGAIKAGVHSSPSLGRSAATVAGGATANAAADEYQAKKEGGYATGGVVGAKTFEFEGKGTGTSDDIPVKVAGNSINVSDGEKAVILPAKTAQNPQALDMIETVIQQSNGGRAPNRGLRNGGAYVNGAIEGPMPLMDDEVRARSAANLAARGRAPGPTVTPTPGGATMKPMIAPMEMPTTLAAEQPGVLRRGLDAAKNRVVSALGGTTTAPSPPAVVTAPATPQATPRPASIAQYTPQMVKEAVKERIPQVLQTVKGAGTGLLKNLNTVANYTVAAGDLTAAGHANEDGGWGLVRDTAMAIPRVMAGAAGADVDLSKVRNGIRGLEAAGNVATGFVADRLPTGWVTGLMGGAANAATGFRPMTRAVQALNGESPIQEMYRTEFNTDREQMPGVFETARNGVAALSSDGQTTVMRNKNGAPAAPAPPAQAQAPDTAQAQPMRLPATPQAYPMSKAGDQVAPDSAPGTRTIRTANGDVTATRDKRGQLIVSAGADDNEATSETKRATEATRMRADMARQVDNFEKMRIDSDLASNSTGDRQRGALRQSVRTANQQAEIEKAKAVNEAGWKQTDLDVRKEDLVLKRGAAQRELEQKQLDNQRAEKEASDKDATQYVDSIKHHFVRRGEKGDEPDDVAKGKFLASAQHTIAQMGARDKKGWTGADGRPMGVGSIDKTDQDRLLNRYKAIEAVKASMDQSFFGADKADSLDMSDFDGVQKGDEIEFPKLTAKFKRRIAVPKRDINTTEGIRKPWNPGMGRTPNADIMASLLDHL